LFAPVGRRDPFDRAGIKSSRTISACCGRVNWKIGKLILREVLGRIG
jgi:hypothetical protein